MGQQWITRRRLGLGLGATLLSGCASPTLVSLIQAPAPGTATGADLAHRMTVPVLVNGQGPFEFVVDTGANRTVISTELAAQLALPSAGLAQIHGIAGAEPAQTVMLDLLQIDSVASRRIRAPTLPRSRLGADGLLGVDVLRDRRVLLDFRRSQFHIAPSRGEEASSFSMRQAGTGRTDGLGQGVRVPARYRFGQLIIVDADVTGRRVTAFLDSGAQSSVGNLRLRSLVGLDRRQASRPIYEAPIQGVTGQTTRGELATLPLLRIGGISISRLTAAFADLHVFDIWGLAATPSLLLGADVMSQFAAIELDYGRKQVTFYPKSG